MSERQIYKRSWHSQADVAELLQAAFASELVAPSRSIWIVSPWISDIPIIDNRTGGFDAVLDASWGQRQVRLAEILARCVTLGTHLQVATRPDSHNATFLSRLEALINGKAAQQRLTVHRAEDLHEKGILTSRFHLGGSMNLTYRGITILEEAIRYATSEEAISLAQLTYHDRWGGVLQQPNPPEHG